MIEITVVIGQRGGGQILGAFDDERLIRNLKAKVKRHHEEGHVIFEKIKINEPREERFGLYFK